jgi:2-polyprenyl-6-methoxyphenol hydroxylase-like FAD-dependent oxidoreductase
METEVLIIGAGPTGLMLAGDIARAGVRCTVLEQRKDRSDTTRAFAVHARTLEELDARGVADDVLKTGTPVSTLQLFGRTHIDLSKLPTKYPFLLVTPQYNTERVLGERARRLGAEIIDGVTVDSLEQSADGVTVHAGDRSYRAKYLVGADGVHSVVRKALGLPFPGQSVVQSLMLADVQLTDPPAEVLTVNANAEGLVFMAPFGDGWYRIYAWDRRHPKPESAPLTLEEVRDITKRVLGTDFGMHDARWTSRFHSDERQAPHYRVGRVFLAGDAAHCHSPAGGMGMNTGIQDAANLGWKLAAVAQGWGSERLLDSYESERHSVGAMVVRMSGTLVRLGVAPTALRRLMRTLVGAVALRIPAIQTKGAMNVSGIGIGYPDGGHRVPDMPDGTLYRELREGKLVLVGPPGTRADGYADRVRLLESSGDEVTLVRPDAYAAWTGTASDVAGLRGALRHWCGDPSVVAA